MAAGPLATVQLRTDGCLRVSVLRVTELAALGEQSLLSALPDVPVARWPRALAVLTIARPGTVSNCVSTANSQGRAYVGACSSPSDGVALENYLQGSKHVRKPQAAAPRLTSAHSG